jgi:CdiI N-terminal domain
VFSIGFTDEPLEYPYDDTRIPAAPGLLVLGKTMEGILANLSVWDKTAYEFHWRRELKSLFEGSTKVALIASFDDPKASHNMEIWPFYRDGDWIRIQNHLLFYDSLPPEFAVSDLNHFLKDRVVVNDDGNPLSEWSVSLRDIELFLHRSGVI